MSNSSRRWLKEHFTDQYVKKSWQDGYRARSVYKLIELNDAHHLIRAGDKVVDLGAAPGSWSQYAREKVGEQGRVFALDRLAIEPIRGVEVIQGDFTDNKVYELLKQRLQGQWVDVVVSDMAPNMSGIKDVDRIQSSYLVDCVIEFIKHHMRRGGRCVYKAFQGPDFEQQIRQMRSMFEEVYVKKPSASRSRSSELYVVAKNCKIV